jgi:hypothetical protein
VKVKANAKTSAKGKLRNEVEVWKCGSGSVVEWNCGSAARER